MDRPIIDRRGFLQRTAETGALASVAGLRTAQAMGAARSGVSIERIRVGVIGCGSVSGSYLPHLKACPYAEVVSACDIIPERAERRAKEFAVPNAYAHIDEMLRGADFELLVNLTDMQEHEHLNRQAIEAGKHVWSEKPIANSLEAGQDIVGQARRRGVRVWGAPIVVASPQFEFMAKTLASGVLGKVAAAHADYGHTGPDWSDFFYEKNGGSMPDLGVYNLTTLTGLLGPAKWVTAMLSIVTPTRAIVGRGEITVAEEDNAMVLIDHGHGTLSHVQCGFNFFNPHGHEGRNEQRHTLSIYGSRGALGLVGYDWEPLGVDVATEYSPAFRRRVTDANGYVWAAGASLVAESLVTGKELRFTPEHALHVVEIISAARKSQRTGQRIEIRSTFNWPVVS